MRVGIGYDVHRLKEDRKLILGGVRVPHEKGLIGHSDADVLAHAITDAILGAAGLGDIGEWFPDTKEEFKDADSIELLKKVLNMIKGKFLINNIDCIIIAEKPRLTTYKKAIKENISKVLGIEEHKVNIKAKSEEGLGFTGRQEGIAAYAIVSLIELGIDIDNQVK
ncbi:MAG: 2-C-methyl-D-erythritol 2,4-cyclodiphosphate synthase [Thermoanaerobacteraceae bacterium]